MLPRWNTTCVSEYESMSTPMQLSPGMPVPAPACQLRVSFLKLKLLAKSFPVFPAPHVDDGGLYAVPSDATLAPNPDPFTVIMGAACVPLTTTDEIAGAALAAVCSPSTTTGVASVTSITTTVRWKRPERPRSCCAYVPDARDPDEICIATLPWAPGNSSVGPKSYFRFTQKAKAFRSTNSCQ